ncbi:MFS transporter [Alicyclobacillus sendaiensis]|uniref:MFS transporter n=1 Tax=Alicyclobacillus sendaiensis TaxID=192387 RepID=UPI00272B370C|nr:MFS transporter [Alicyclobacillus sendaiensis]
MEVPTQRPGFNRYIVLLVLQKFFSSALFYGVVASLFMVSRGLDYTDIFTLESVLALVLFLVDIPSSAWADRYDRKWILVLGHAAAVASVTLFAWAHRFWVFAVSYALSGVGIAVLSGVESAYVYDLCKAFRREEQSTRIYAWLNASEKCATLLSFPLGSWLAAHGYVSTVYATAAVNTVGLLLAFLLPSQQPKEDFLRREDEDVTEERGTLASVWVFLVSNPVLLFFALAGPAVWVVFNGFHYLNQPLFVRARLPVHEFGWVMAAGSLAAMVISPFVDGIRRKLGFMRPILASAIAMASAFGCMAWTNDLALIVLAILVLNVSESLRSPLLNSATNSLVPSETRATVLSVLSAVGTLLTLVLNPVIGYCADHSVAAGLLLSGGLILLFTVGSLPALFRMKEVGEASSIARE